MIRFGLWFSAMFKNLISMSDRWTLCLKPLLSNKNGECPWRQEWPRWVGIPSWFDRVSCSTLYWTRTWFNASRRRQIPPPSGTSKWRPRIERFVSNQWEQPTTKQPITGLHLISNLSSVWDATTTTTTATTTRGTTSSDTQSAWSTCACSTKWRPSSIPSRLNHWPF